MTKLEYKAGTTGTEISYLNSIGESYPVNGKTMLDYLKGYKIGAEKRVEWGMIDKHKIMTHLDKLIYKFSNGKA
jgi:hypothetical protein